MSEPLIEGPPAEQLVPPEPTLPSLRDAAAGCRACELWRLGTQTVFGEGPAPAAGRGRGGAAEADGLPGRDGGAGRAGVVVPGAARPGPVLPQPVRCDGHGDGPPLVDPARARPGSPGASLRRLRDGPPHGR